MKRLNPSTGEVFRRGDTREDGFLFWSYTNRIKKDGFFTEQWYNQETFESGKNLNRKSAIDWVSRNKKKFQARYREWDRANQHKKNARTAKYRSIKLSRTPHWLTDKHYAEMAAMYKIAKQQAKITGVPHHVDHIVPLQGENVSGLHVPWNLQVITATENMSKGNKYGV